MAKVNSKYFADVIAKLLEAKRKENIIINESFRDEFRVKLMARAVEVAENLGVRTVVQTSEELRAVDVRDDLRATNKFVDRDTSDVTRDELPDSAPIDWYGFVKKFRYALALVPSALLVVMASNLIMNMPVGMESEVVVPTSRTSDERDTSDVERDTADVKPLFMTGEMGVEVLPEELPAPIQTLDERRDTVQITDERDTSDIKTPRVAVPTARTSDERDTSDVERDTSDVDFEDFYRDYMMEFNLINQPTGGSTIKSQVSLPTVAETTTSSVTPTSSQTKNVETNATVTTSPVTYSQKTTSPVTAVPTNVTSAGAGATGADAIFVSAPINYYTNLNGVEKQILAEIVDRAVDVEEVSAVHVYSLSGDMIEVLVQFEDGTSMTKNLRRSGGNGALDDVTLSGYFGPIEYRTDFSYERTSF